MGPGRDSIEIAADNVAPTASAGGPYCVAEGEFTRAEAIAGDAGAEDVLHIPWDVNGDNIFGDVMGQSPTLTWKQLNALGITNGPATFNVGSASPTVTAASRNSSSTPLTLANSPPQNLQITVDQPAGPFFEGTQIVLSGSFVDPGVDESHTYLWQVTSSNGQ